MQIIYSNKNTYSFKDEPNFPASVARDNEFCVLQTNFSLDLTSLFVNSTKRSPFASWILSLKLPIFVSELPENANYTLLNKRKRLNRLDPSFRKACSVLSHSSGDVSDEEIYRRKLRLLMGGKPWKRLVEITSLVFWVFLVYLYHSTLLHRRLHYYITSTLFR